MDAHLINRLGFDAWADNKFVNAIEDYNLVATGEVKMENEHMTMKLSFTEQTISCVIRAYTEDGWKTYDKEFKR
jgi:hypothetical protein